MNTLNQEQIAVLKQISNLPQKEREEALQKFLAALKPEQRAQLVQQECIFCSISQGTVASYKLYEDSEFIAILDIHPATKGHVLVFPKEHYSSLLDIPHSELFFALAQKLSKAILMGVNAHDFNIYIAQGAVAGQHIPHCIMHIIPRFTNDTINFTWKGQTADMHELAKIRETIITHIQIAREEPVVYTMVKEDYIEEERIP